MDIGPQAEAAYDPDAYAWRQAPSMLPHCSIPTCLHSKQSSSSQAAADASARLHPTSTSDSLSASRRCSCCSCWCSARSASSWASLADAAALRACSAAREASSARCRSSHCCCSASAAECSRTLMYVWMACSGQPGAQPGGEVAAVVAPARMKQADDEACGTHDSMLQHCV